MELDPETHRRLNNQYVMTGVVPPGGLKVNIFTGVIETVEEPILRVNAKGELESFIPPSVKLGNLRDLRVKTPPTRAQAPETTALQVNAQGVLEAAAPPSIKPNDVRDFHVNAQGKLEAVAPRTVKLGDLPTQAAPPTHHDFPKTKDAITRTSDTASDRSVETSKGPALDPFKKN